MTKEQVIGFGPFEKDEVLIEIKAMTAEGNDIGGIVMKVDRRRLGEPVGMRLYWEPVIAHLANELNPQAIAAEAALPAVMGRLLSQDAPSVDVQDIAFQALELLRTGADPMKLVINRVTGQVLVGA